MSTAPPVTTTVATRTSPTIRLAPAPSRRSTPFAPDALSNVCSTVTESSDANTSPFAPTCTDPKPESGRTAPFGSTTIRAPSAVRTLDGPSPHNAPLPDSVTSLPTPRRTDPCPTRTGAANDSFARDATSFATPPAPSVSGPVKLAVEPSTVSSPVAPALPPSETGQAKDAVEPLRNPRTWRPGPSVRTA